MFRAAIAFVMLFFCAGCNSSRLECQAEWNRRIGEEAQMEFAKTMKQGAPSPAHDFVSQYDFANAALEDLPWELHQLTVAGDEFFDYCEFVRKQHPDWNYLEFNFPDPEPRSYDQVDRTTCRLTNSGFSGNINDGFKICDIGFTDVNHDGFMDAVLLLVQQGYGSSRVSGVYVLTRKQPGMKFIEVQDK